MKNCNNCKLIDYDMPIEDKLFRCKRDSKKRFNYPKIHGWFCRRFEKKEGEK